MGPDDERPTDAHDAVDAPDDGEPSTIDDSHLEPGTNVGGYVIEGELGSGGMGVVYAATHPVIGKRAAIKVLKPELSGNPAAVERFMMEARAVNQIGHPNIVDIFAFGALPDGRSYYVMDFLSGETLRKRLKRGPVHVSEAASIIDEVTSALISAHDKGIIHRDLKPDNIFMVSVPGRWPEVRILDWGLLKLSSTQSAVSSGKYRTLAGSVLGTPVYMSPEQARASDAVDSRTDVYSLGVMSFELLAGFVPFKKGSSIDTLLAHQDEPVPSLAAHCPALPEELCQLIEAMLAKEAEGRPTLAAVRAVLKRLKGTKIPTMTAAGLEMPPLTSSSPAIDLNPSMQLTNPNPQRRSKPDSAYPSMSDAMPLPAPPPTPLPDQASMSPYASMNVSSDKTLAGHSMPDARQHAMRPTPVPGSMPNLPAGVSMQHQQYPPLMAPGYSAQMPPQQSGHMPPQYAQMPPHHSGHMAPAAPQRPSQPQLQPAPSGARRLIVILVVAVLASAAGIILLLAN